MAVNEEEKALRLGSCKRSPERLVQDLPRFEGHIGRFLEAFPRYAAWTVERVAIAPRLDREARAAIEDRGFLPQDLDDLLDGLASTSSP